MFAIAANSNTVLTATLLVSSHFTLSSFDIFDSDFTFNLLCRGWLREDLVAVRRWHLDNGPGRNCREQQHGADPDAGLEQPLHLVAL